LRIQAGSIGIEVQRPTHTQHVSSNTYTSNPNISLSTNNSFESGYALSVSFSLLPFTLSQHSPIANMAAIDWERGEPQGLVPLQPEHRLFVSVYGPDRVPGTPIIIFIPGVTCSITEWVVVRRLLQPRFRTLLYERSGMGASDESLQPPTASDMALELDTLLKAMRIAPPYVIVCHSYGGIISREFLELCHEDNRNEDVVGMVMVDANQERSTVLWPDSNIEAISQGLDWNTVTGLSKARVLTDTEWQAFRDEQGSEKHQRTAKKEMEHYVDSCATLLEKHQFDRDPPLLNRYPVSVLKGHPELDLRKAFEAGVLAGNGTREQRSQFSEKLAAYPAINDQLQRENLGLSRNHRFVDVRGHGHFIHITAPEAVVEGVKWVLQSV
jgi:pimeloyl-ACP methyl ester carboxylesterase